MEVAGLVMGLIPLTLRFARSLDRFVQDYRGVSDEIKKYRDELNRYTATLIRTQMVLNDAECMRGHEDRLLQKPAGFEAFEVCAKSIQDVLVLLETRSGWKKHYRKIKLALRSRDLRDSIEDIHRFCEQISQDTVVSVLQVSKATKSLVGRLLNAHTRSEDLAILNWLAPGTYSQRHKELVKEWHPGTIGWVFDQPEFVEWESGLYDVEREAYDEKAAIDWADTNSEEDYDPRIIWYHGALVERLMERRPLNVAVLYIYCDYNQRETQTLSALMACLLRQATEQVTRFREFPEEVRKTFQQHAAWQHGPLSEWDTQQLLEQLLVNFNKCVIVVDGLDEHSDTANDRQIYKPSELLYKILECCEGSGDSIRIFLTSREHLLAPHADVNAVRVTMETADSDIRLYTESKITDAYFSQSPLFEASTKDQNRIIRAVAEKADKQ
ncbi:hypothetical protein ACHAQA_003244 [Verticillium albo-atrum]